MWDCKKNGRILDRKSCRRCANTSNVALSNDNSHPKLIVGAAEVACIVVEQIGAFGASWLADEVVQT